MLFKPIGWAHVSWGLRAATLMDEICTRSGEVLPDVLVLCSGVEPAELFCGGPFKAYERRGWGAGTVRIGYGNDGIDGARSGIEQGLEPCRHLAVEADRDDPQVLPDGGFNLQAHIGAVVRRGRCHEEQESCITDGGKQGTIEGRAQCDRAKIPPNVGTITLKVGDEFAGEARVLPRITDEGQKGCPSDTR
jgi:hypothetical protein